MPIPLEPFSSRRPGLAVSGVMLAIFLFAVDATVVGTAMPTVVARLGGLELYSWVFTAYILTSALATALSGKLSDLYGQRRLLLIGIGLFTLGSALCGMAQSMEQLVIFRAVQGVGGGAVLALSFIVVGLLFPPEQRAKMQGRISGLWGIASILGPLAGGVITEYWNWRWIFFINLPICIVAAALIIFGLAEVTVGGNRRPDLKGAVTLLLGLALLFYSLEESQRRFFAFDATLAAMLVSALVLLALFYAFERRSEEPLLPPGLFRIRSFGIFAGVAWLASMGMFGLISYLPLYVQGVLGASASRAGFALLWISLGWTAGSLSAAHGMNRFGYRRTCAVGMLLMALGYGLFLGTAGRVGFIATLAVGAVIGVGMGISGVTCMVAAQNGVPLSRLGVATSTIMLCRMFGGAFGINLLGGVLFSQMHRRLASLSSGSGVEISGSLIEKLADPRSLLDPATRALIPDSLLAPLVDTLAHSIWSAFLAGFFIMLFGFGFSFLMPDATPADARKAQI